jgi:hypothetical protein
LVEYEDATACTPSSSPGYTNTACLAAMRLCSSGLTMALTRRLGCDRRGPVRDRKRDFNMIRLILARVVALRTACVIKVRLPDIAGCQASAGSLSLNISHPLTPSLSNPPLSSYQMAAAEPLFHFIGLRSLSAHPHPPSPPTSNRLVSNSHSHSPCRSELRPSLWRDRHTRGRHAIFRDMVADAVQKTGNVELMAACEAYMQAGGTFYS